MKKAFLGLALIISSVIHPITYNTTLLFNPTTKHKVAILSDVLMNDESAEKLAEIVDEQNNEISYLAQALAQQPYKPMFISEGTKGNIPSKKSGCQFEYHRWIVPHLFLDQQSSIIGNLALQTVYSNDYSEIDRFICTLAAGIDYYYSDQSEALFAYSVPTPKADKIIEETPYSRYSITEYCKIITHRCNELLKKISPLPNPLKEQLQKEITKLADTIILYIRHQAHKIGMQESDNIFYISINEVLNWSKYLEHYIQDLYYREHDIALLSSVATNSQYPIIVQCSSHYAQVLQRCLVLNGYHCVSTQEDNSFVIDDQEDQLDTLPLFRRNDHSLESPVEIFDLFLWSEEFSSKKVLLFFSECNL